MVEPPNQVVVDSETLVDFLSKLPNIQSSLAAAAATSDGKSKKREASSPLQEEADRVKKQRELHRLLASVSPSHARRLRDPQPVVPAPVADDESLKFTKMFCVALQNETVKQLLGTIIHDQVELATADHEERIRVLESNNLMQDIRNNEMSKVVRSLEVKVDDLEQYGRRNALRIQNNWPEEEGEDTDQIVRQMCTDLLDVQLQAGDIGRSHRVGRKDRTYDRPRAIIVKFPTYRIREKVFRSRKKLKDAGDEGKHIRINEDLTAKRSSLSYRARQLKRNKLIQDTWTQDGRVLVKDNEGRIGSVSSEEELKQDFDPDDTVGDFAPAIPRY